MSGTTLRLGKLALVVFTCFVLSVVAQPTKECDKKSCKGPLMFYKDLNCKPIYKKPNDCCAVRYDCGHLFAARSSDKCYINGKVYSVGEPLKDEDRSSACDVGCFCSKIYGNEANFVCATVDCFRIGQAKPGCYTKYSPDNCCGGEEVCPKTPEEKKVTCVVDGHTYFEGQSFYPESDELLCICKEGYEGKNVEPFCKPTRCGVELRSSKQIRDKCVPFYYPGQTPQRSCSGSFRCQNKADVVIPSAHEKSALAATSDDFKCKFGNLTLNIGDELNQATDYSSVCVKCVCEVPPILTCQKLSSEECTEDYSKFAIDR